MEARRGWTNSPHESIEVSDSPDNIALLLLATEAIKKRRCEKVMGTLYYRKGCR